MMLLIVAGVISGMPLGVQIIKSGLLQLGAEPQEASRTRAPPGGAPIGGSCSA
jgi:ABC-type Fe3+ transport system permease subunit